MRYPVPVGEEGDPHEEDSYEEPKMDTIHEPFKWDLDAHGQLTAHM
jgi:hypothetical protein